MTSPLSSPNRRRRRIVVVTVAVIVLGLGIGWWFWPRTDQRFVGTWKSAGGVPIILRCDGTCTIGVTRKKWSTSGNRLYYIDDRRPRSFKDFEQLAWRAVGARCWGGYISSLDVVEVTESRILFLYWSDSNQYVQERKSFWERVPAGSK